MKTGDYALGMMPLVIHVAEALDGVGSSDPAPSVSALAKMDFKPQINDVFRVRVNEGCKDDHDAMLWMIRFALDKLGDQVVQDGNGYRLAVPYSKLKVDEQKVPRRRVESDDQVRLDKIKMAYLYMSDPKGILHYRGKGGVKFTVHEKARMFDRMTFEEFHKLCDSIEINGLRTPVIVHEKQIIDGLNRAAACEAMGVPLEYTNLKGEAGDLDIALLVWDLNVNRREKPAPPARLALLNWELFGEKAKEIAEANLAAGRAKGTAQTKGSQEVLPDSPYPQFKGKQAGDIAIELSGAEKKVSGRSVREILAAVKDAPETRQKVLDGEITTIPAAKKAGEQERGTVVEVPPSASELSKTAWKRFGDAKTCLEKSIDHIKAGRVGGTKSRPLTYAQWEDRFWEINALLADLKFAVDDLYGEGKE